MEVGIVTVGDELLAGETVNSNASWLGRNLAERGVDVRRVTVVPDEIDEIVSVVDHDRDAYDAVIVTGGLGPTHDDRTMEAIAAVFDRPLVEDDTVLEWLADAHGYDRESLTHGTADLPNGATPIHNEEGVAPGVHIENVYVFPGVPAEMQAMFERVSGDFVGVTRYTEAVRVAEPESALVPRLDRLRREFDVQVGSYPGGDVLIRLSSEDEAEVEAAAAWLRERVTLVESGAGSDSDSAAESPEEGEHPDPGQDDAQEQDHRR